MRPIFLVLFAAACHGTHPAQSVEKPVIARFAAAPDALPAGGGHSTLSWTATGAATMSISPGVAAVTGTSIDVAVSATTEFVLTAANSAGSVTAKTTVAVAAPVLDVQVGISPASISLGPNAPAQSTAPVSGTPDTAVTWSASGGSIAASGAYTAPGTDGGYIVRAT